MSLTAAAISHCISFIFILFDTAKKSVVAFRDLIPHDIFCLLLQGPRPPSDPHGRYADNKHMSGMGMSSLHLVIYFSLTGFDHYLSTLCCPLAFLDMMGPRSSSPANMDVSVSLS